MEPSVPDRSVEEVPAAEMPAAEMPAADRATRDGDARGDRDTSRDTSGDVGAHTGPWTEAEHHALVARARAAGGGRVELVDGALLVGPGPGPGPGPNFGAGAACADVVEAVRTALAGALPAGLRVASRLALRLCPGSVLLPDLAVTRAPSPDDPDGPDGVLDAADVLLVVEVIGREHGTPYRLFKPQLYARSRIPYSVLIDHDVPFGVADMLIGGRYHEYARSTDGAVLVVEQPFPLVVPIAPAS